MLFSEALQQLKNGVPMRRDSWAVSEGYLMLMPGMKHVWKIMMEPNPNAGNFIFAVEDFFAEDWNQFVPGQEPVEAVAEAA